MVITILPVDFSNRNLYYKSRPINKEKNNKVIEGSDFKSVLQKAVERVNPK
ncbi:hypothetical protein AAGG74_16365 [Bacillus mexicanus]|uniref:hypothetical protein n=1 Tax=Bacillus mexicanus TaxID=2834415 RepID=UPI003D24D2F3